MLKYPKCGHEQETMTKDKQNRLVVADKGWAETIPEWLLEEVKFERLLYSFASLMKGGKTQVGDAEIAVYLYTLSLRQPLSHEDANIYFYLCTKLLEKKGAKVPEDIRKEKLDDYEKGLLEELREEIYRKRGGEIKSPLLNALRQLKKGKLGQNKKGKK